MVNWFSYPKNCFSSLIQERREYIPRVSTFLFNSQIRRLIDYIPNNYLSRNKAFFNNIIMRQILFCNTNPIMMVHYCIIYRVRLRLAKYRLRKYRSIRFDVLQLQTMLYAFRWRTNILLYHHFCPCWLDYRCDEPNNIISLSWQSILFTWLHVPA